MHIHTTASDGQWKPRELGVEAKKRGLKVIAVTDHDSTEGIAEAEENLPDGVELVPGVEISTDYKGSEVHILGYWVDKEHENLQRTLKTLRESRVVRMEKMVARLNQLGMKLQIDDVAALGVNMGRLHLAQVLFDKGYVVSKDDAFRKYIGYGGLAYEKREKVTPMEAIVVIREAKGVPVLAHPGSMRQDALILELLPYGLIGMEVIHSKHSPWQREHYLNLSKKHGLLPSGGSDCHGKGGKDRVLLGSYQIPEAWVEALRKSR